jgi:hypothetical protein
MMLRDAMLRHWWDEWMNEVRKGNKRDSKWLN